MKTEGVFWFTKHFFNFKKYNFLTDMKLDINLQCFINNTNTVEFNTLDKPMHMVWCVSLLIPQYTV